MYISSYINYVLIHHNLFALKSRKYTYLSFYPVTQMTVGINPKKTKLNVPVYRQIKLNCLATQKPVIFCKILGGLFWQVTMT